MGQSWASVLSSELNVGLGGAHRSWRLPSVCTRELWQRGPPRYYLGKSCHWPNFPEALQRSLHRMAYFSHPSGRRGMYQGAGHATFLPCSNMAHISLLYPTQARPVSCPYAHGLLAEPPTAYLSLLSPIAPFCPGSPSHSSLNHEPGHSLSTADPSGKPCLRRPGHCLSSLLAHDRSWLLLLTAAVASKLQGLSGRLSRGEMPIGHLLA